LSYSFVQKTLLQLPTYSVLTTHIGVSCLYSCVHIYARDDEFLVVDDFFYDLPPVTHPNGVNDCNYPPLIYNA